MDNEEISTRVVKMAAGEAVSSGVAEIMPVHLLIALSRMSEDHASSASSEVALRQEFDSLGIEARKFRRRLRGLLALRAENKPPPSVRLSESTKSALAVAEGLACGSDDAPFLVHLLRAVFLRLGDMYTQEHQGAADEIPHEL